MNLVAGKCWMELALRQVCLRAWRVESKSNLRDGPTRSDVQWVDRLGAVYTDPVLPDWLYRVWSLRSPLLIHPVTRADVVLGCGMRYPQADRGAVVCRYWALSVLRLPLLAAASNCVT